MNEEKMPTYGELLAKNFRLEHNERVLLDRIKKAIEYINENEDVDLYDDVGSAFFRELLEILRGKDENN